ncbi:hypothetical protein [Caldiplasma sukawensis]
MEIKSIGMNYYLYVAGEYGTNSKTNEKKNVIMVSIIYKQIIWIEIYVAYG